MLGALKKISDKLSGWLDAYMDKFGASLRTKLIVIFLIVKIVPLVLLLLIAWIQFARLGNEVNERTNDLAEEMNLTLTDAGELAITDATVALNTSAVEQIERLTTDTAQDVARFLYNRDDDLLYLATIEPSAANYSDFINNKRGNIANRGSWALADDGMSWIRTDGPVAEDPGDVSTNVENNDEADGVGFHHRLPDLFLEDYVKVPYYDEITYIGTDLREQIKVTASGSTKANYPLGIALGDVSNKGDTYVGAETYGSEIRSLKPGEIYVSDVIGKYVPSHFIGMYTPKQMIVSAIGAESTALKGADGETLPEETREYVDALTDITQREIPESVVEGGVSDQAACDALMAATADKAVGLLDEAGKLLESDELKERNAALKEKISKLSFKPSQEAYAGEENPIGVRFEGIVRFVTPVADSRGNVQGYVSFALNHDHIMEFMDHISPMTERYTELPSAYDGNYAFIWDYQCRSIVHPRHHSIVGYNPDTGNEEIPWLENSLYQELLTRVGGSGLADLEANWAGLTNNPQIPSQEWPGVDSLVKDVPVFNGQTRQNKPSPDLTAAGYVGLDGRYLNTAPQCTGWMNLTEDGGSGSFYILWSGLYKLTTAAAIPYYTGQYAPTDKNGFSRRGFAMVTIGAGLDSFQKPAQDTADKLDAAIAEANENVLAESEKTQETIVDNMTATSIQLVATTAIIVFLVVLIAIWMASFIANNVTVLIGGVTKFRLGDRRFRFHTERADEFGELADSFDEMADSITDSVHTPLVITDMDMKILYINELGSELIGRAEKDLIGTPYRDASLYPVGTEYDPIAVMLEGRQPSEFKNEKDGRYYRGDAQYLFDKNENKIGYIITSTDVTELSLGRERLEKAVKDANKANEAKGQFLARMSHEIRTPMNAIVGITNIVEKKLGEIGTGEGNPKIDNIREHVAQIENSSHHLLGLLNDILDLSKIEAGKIEISEEMFNLENMAETVKEIILPRCGSKAIELNTKFDDSIATPVVSDSLRLRQVLINLLGNSVKFTPESGRIDFFIDRMDETEDKYLVKYTVGDNGIGISKDAIGGIFDLFEQADGSITRRFGGTGLGLPISQTIVNLMGGEIAVDSKEGEGSVFSFELWMRKSDTESMAYEGAEPAPADVDYTGKRILIVDDVDINRMILGTLLEDTGIGILEAEDGEEAIKIFEDSEEGSIDLILMDVMMPVMNGLEAAKRIREMDRSDAGTVPIIAVTANAFKEDAEKTISAGMNAHLSKPIDPDSLNSALYKYLILKK
ncbi:MAG: response regulator [Clostridiales Family XIII bacterium]|jgi:signal transduction histidine kinase/ActR/RegA family two-component response regulator|nr:response regulator [Clostridiales Family XIII bacterium]